MRWIALLLFVSVFALGRLVILRRSSSMSRLREAVAEFRKRFSHYVSAHGESDQEAEYEWLMRQVVWVQRIVQEWAGFDEGAGGIPYARQRSDRLLLEVLEAMAVSEVHEMRLVSAGNLLTRALGAADRRQEELRRQAWNPLVWYREGIRALVLLPASVGAWASGKSSPEGIEEDDQPWVRRRILWLGVVFPLLVVLALAIGPDRIMEFGLAAYRWIVDSVSEFAGLIAQRID